MLAAALAVSFGCSSGSAGDRANRGAFKVNLISTGLSQVYPYRVREVDSFGNPTSVVRNVEGVDDLQAHVNANNGVLPIGTFATTATLPDGNAGNHFFLLRFSNKVAIDSVLSNQLAGQSNSGLTTAVSLLAYNPATESSEVLRGRGFVNGETYVNVNGALQRIRAVSADENGVVTVEHPVGAGFPRGFSGDEDLVKENTFVFVADTDSDLSTLETFDSTKLLRVIVTNAVRNTDGKVLVDEVCTATSVGTDLMPPEVLGYTPNQTLQITPGNNAQNVDPTGSILVRFNKPVQPADVGSFFSPADLIPATGGVTLAVTVAANTFSLLYYADPVGYGDLCNYRLTPAYNFPGGSAVTVTINSISVRGLGGLNLGNTVQTTFTTGAGPGIVNAPVSPEAIYVGVSGTEPGVAVIDLNGFGQGTGSTTDSRFALNPNVGAPGVTPTLAPGTSNVDAGSRGALTLTTDSNGNTRLIGAPTLGNVADIHVGNALDLVFNNENVNRNATKANQQNPLTILFESGNSITVAPHPNPPRLLFPPPNPARAIFGEEPTTSSNPLPSSAPPCTNQPINLLTQGNPFANTVGEVGLFGQNPIVQAVFYGPQPPPASPPPPTPQCPFWSRQQVGHFLYVLDRDNRQVVILNSNRFTVLDSIKLTDPIDMSISPNLRVLAVSNFSSATVTFIDINPLSLNFHTVIGETRVAQGPTQVVWQPDGEAVLVISRIDNALSVIRGLDFQLAKTVTGFINNPIDVVVSERFQTSGNLSGVYYAYVLNASGSIAVYESGPEGVNGIGFNNIIGVVPNQTFRRARKLFLDPLSQLSGILVAHVDESGLGQISRLELTSSPQGQLPTQQNNGGFIVPPTFRQKEWTVSQRFGGLDPTSPRRDLFSGNAPVDIALDDIFNYGGSPDQVTPFNQTAPLPPTSHSGKGFVKNVAGANLPAYLPILMFVALADTGKVDVFEFGSGKRVRTLDVPGVSVVSNYWRQ